MQPMIFKTLIPFLMLSACEPVTVLMGGGAAVGGLASREKGVSGAMSDSWISTKIKAKLYKFDQDLHAHVGVNVQEGEVLLTGSVVNQDWIAESERMCWEVDGVKQVLNNIGVDDGNGGVKVFAGDAVITSMIKTHLLFGNDIRSMNYSIKTVSGVVYVMGIAQSDEELNQVMEYARNTKGVDRVVSYVRIKNNPTAASSSEESPPSSENSTEE